MEVSCSDRKKVIWEVLDNHVVEDPKDNDDILLWVFGFNFFTNTGGGGGNIKNDWLSLFINVN